MTSINRLATESSLYLRQHSRNPVDWYPWGPEAIARARETDRPIFLSIGYSACHWCHVMERECFESEAIAAILNERFVCIKVDREERPDIDDIYMKSVQLLNRGQGGWPMSVWLTPKLQPFYAGTYFPPADRYGRPGFPRLLVALADAWRDRRDDITRTAGEITEQLHAFTASTGPSTATTEQLLKHSARQLRGAYDSRHGGFGSAPKFPHALELGLLLRVARRFDDADALGMVRETLRHMARGGIYDQLGGGFHRYSVDAQWLVPHFEKMLYDNALLSVCYLETHQVTGDPFFRQIVEETLDYVTREMTSPGGGFYSTQDADSEGEEGKFFVWSLDEIRDVLGDSADEAIRRWGVTLGGNFEGHNILTRATDDTDDDAFRALRQTLWAAREKRVKPARDEKILAAWNGLMITAFARAGAALDRPDYVATAVRAADFIEARLVRPDGRLFRTCGDDGAGRFNGYLEDYAALALAYSHLFDATLDERWLARGARLLHAVLDHFADPAGGFFTTSDDHEELVLRPKDLHDGSTPSGNALAVTALIRIGHQIGDSELRLAGERAMRALLGVAEAHPSAAGQLLIAAEFLLGPVQEVCVVGDAGCGEFQQVLRIARGAFSPGRVFTSAQGRSATAPVTMYLCENATCLPPVSEMQQIEELLRR